MSDFVRKLLRRPQLCRAGSSIIMTSSVSKLRSYDVIKWSLWRHSQSITRLKRPRYPNSRFTYPCVHECHLFRKPIFCVSSVGEPWIESNGRLWGPISRHLLTFEFPLRWSPFKKLATYLCVVFSSFLHIPRVTFFIFHPCIDFSPETQYLGTGPTGKICLPSFKIRLQTLIFI